MHRMQLSSISGSQRNTHVLKPLPLAAQLIYRHSLTMAKSGAAVPKVLACWHLTGTLDERAMTLAVRGLAADHDILRIHVEQQEDRGMIREVVVPDLSLEDVPEHDLSRKMDDWNRQRTPPGHPSCRYRLFRLGPDRFCLGFGGGHEVLDAWPIDTMTGELAERYNLVMAGQPAEKRSGPGFVDVATWLDALVDSGELDDSRYYWRTLLQGSSPPLSTPLAPDPSRHPMTQVRAMLPLPVDIRDSFLALTKAAGCSSFEGYFTAYALLLAKIGTAGRPLTAFVASLRRLPELRTIAGCLLNRLYIPVAAQSDEGFKIVAQRLRATLKDAKKHLLWPTWLDVDPDGTGYPSFFFHYAPEEQIGLPVFTGLHCTSLDIYPQEYSPLPLVIKVAEHRTRPMLVGMAQAGFCSAAGLEKLLQKYLQTMADTVATNNSSGGH